MEYRLIAADGKIVWVLDETVAVRDAEYHPIMLQGCLVDVTDRHDAVRSAAAPLRRGRLGGHCVALAPRRPAALVRAHAAVRDLEDAVGDPVEEVAVVRHEDRRPLERLERASRASRPTRCRGGSSARRGAGSSRRSSISSRSCSRVHSPPDSESSGRRTCSYPNRNFISRETASPSEIGAVRRTSSSGVAFGSSGRRSCASRPKRIDGPALRSPSSGSSSPPSSRRSTDLPAPFSPTTPTRSPRSTVRSTPSRICSAAEGDADPVELDDPLAAAQVRT